ncbi:MAG: 23S rRNA (uracil(1939)-C(5))-methyltransferase RlmD [Clostridiales bacterium]|jgi:23S rRNA (uracil1939-C5)-methyltransferase|nr:23S rRNA (uracil(1939)-C(5))-methyltransferase RlmD [Clostridiales bacterium]
MVRNDVLQLEITGLTSECDGVGRASGLAVFVEGALPGDTVMAKITKLKKSYAHGRTIRLVKPSPDRVTPPCKALKCGGCSLQHASYESQLRLKRQRVQDDLERLGGIHGVTVPEAIGMKDPLHYRNKALYPVGMSNGKLVMGFYEKGSHDIIPADACLIQSESCSAALAAIQQFVEGSGISIYDEATNQGLLRHVLIRVGEGADDSGNKVEEIMVCLVINGDTLPNILYLKNICSRMIPTLKTIVLNTNTKASNTILGSACKTIWGPGFIHKKIFDLVFEVSPLSFFQVNTAQAEVLFGLVLEMAELEEDETAVDLHCGAGAITLLLARKAKSAIGIEISEEAVKDAVRNAELNSIKNVEFIAAPAEEAMPALVEKGATADLVVVDPPRKGCDPATIAAILAMAPKKIVYVSCDPGTLARDLKILINGGYSLDRIQPLDMFPMTSHVETVTRLTKTETAPEASQE